MILEIEPSTVGARLDGWPLYETAERILMIHGQQLHLRKDCSYSKNLFLFRRTHLIELIALSRFQLDSGEGIPVVCLDIGSNLGYVSSYLSLRSDVKQVLSFEPDPVTFETLEKNAAHYTKIIPINKAVDQIPGIQVNLWLGNSNSAHNMVSRMSDDHPKPSAVIDSLREQPIEIFTTSVDSFETDPVGLIKIDVQGNEFNVIQGAWNTISRDQPLIWMEFTPEEVSSSREDLLQITRRIITDFGYGLFTSTRYGYLEALTVKDLSNFQGDLFLSPAWMQYRGEFT